MTTGHTTNDPISSSTLTGALSKKPLMIAVFSGIVLLAFFALIIYLLGINETTTATVRDIAIILLATLTILIGFVTLVLVLFLVYLVVKIIDLIQLINTELKPFFARANDTATKTKDTVQLVQDRVTFISDEAVKPIINGVSSVYAIKAVLRTLFRQ